MPERNSPWGSVNRCVVCGTKLIFLRTTMPDTKPEEGSKSCSKNHEKFQVFGGYNSAGEWRFDFVMPKSGARRQRP